MIAHGQVSSPVETPRLSDIEARIAALRPWPEGESVIQALERYAAILRERDQTTSEPLSGLDAAWAALRATRLGSASGIRITLADLRSGDGYFEPFYEAWRATLTGDGIESIQSEATGGPPAAALFALAARLASPETEPTAGPKAKDR